jgi:hypothetical protein
MGKCGRSRGDIPRYRCLLSKAVLLTKPGVAEGCAARKMDDDCELRSHVMSDVTSHVMTRRGVLVTESRVRDNGMAELNGLKF